MHFCIYMIFKNIIFLNPLIFSENSMHIRFYSITDLQENIFLKLHVFVVEYSIAYTFLCIYDYKEKNIFKSAISFVVGDFYVINFG